MGFPEGYSDSFRLLFAYDRPDNRQVRVICGNDAAASWAEGAPFPYGSILVMETYRAKIGTDRKPALDARGRYVRESLTGVFIMRKEPGFGEDYGPLGEWEYVAFRPDGKTYSSPPSATANCASCHLALKETPDADWVFRTNRIAAEDMLASGKAPTQGPHDVLMNSMAFGPNTLTIPVGTDITWANRDSMTHTVVTTEQRFASGPVAPGRTFSHKFEAPGSFAYVCSIHPEQMRGTIKVE